MEPFSTGVEAGPFSDAISPKVCGMRVDRVAGRAYHRQMTQCCVLCNSAPADTVEHVPARQFFDPPLPSDLITVPACKGCNNRSQADEEYFRAFLMLLKSPPTSQAAENVRQRVARQLDRPAFGGLRKRFEETSTLRWIGTADGELIADLRTKPERERLWSVMTKYVRALYFHIHGVPLATDVVFSIERLFNRATRPPEYWEPLLDAATYAEGGTTMSVGGQSEFRYSYRTFPHQAHLMEIIVMEFYDLFPYVAMIFRPGTDLTKPVMMPTRKV
jgi:hypothetical protein